MKLFIGYDVHQESRYDELELSNYKISPLKSDLSDMSVIEEVHVDLEELLKRGFSLHTKANNFWDVDAKFTELQKAEELDEIVEARLMSIKGELERAKEQINRLNIDNEYLLNVAINRQKQVDNYVDQLKEARKQIREHQKGQRFVGFMDNRDRLWLPTEKKNEYTWMSNVKNINELKTASFDAKPHYEKV